MFVWMRVYYTLLTYADLLTQSWSILGYALSRGFTPPAEISVNLLFPNNICSMTGAMLILLAARRCAGLQESMSARFSTLDNNLQRSFESWIQVPGSSRSPSVAQCLQVIKDIDILLQTE